MINKKENSLQKLEQIAGDAGMTSNTYEKINEPLRQHSANVSIQKSEESAKQAIQTYGEDSDKVFDAWYSDTSDFDLNEDTRKYYWDKYETLAGDKNVAREALSNQVKSRLKTLETTSEKEYYIRDNLNRWPDWMIEKYEPSLANLMIVNQTKDMMKGETVYRDSTLNKVSSLLDSESLAPDIAEEDHINDLLKLETLGFLSGAVISDGRIGVTNREQEFQPAWSVKNQEEISDKYTMSSPAELAFLRDSVSSGIKDLVSVNLSEGRSNIKNQSNELRFAMLSEIRQGNIEMDRWGDVASMIENPGDDPIGSLLFLFDEGIKGMIDKAEQGSDSSVNEKEVVTMINNAFIKYAPLFGELNNG
tara:strand:+ start:48872 stop:49957 length:1086 start_codon:yes stop_codon:yes gene_type:complete